MSILQHSVNELYIFGGEVAVKDHVPPFLFKVWTLLKHIVFKKSIYKRALTEPVTCR